MLTITKHEQKWFKDFVNC